MSEATGTDWSYNDDHAASSTDSELQDLSFGRHAKSALQTAEWKARAEGHQEIGTDDILWALFHDAEQSDSLALKFLKKRGVTKRSLYSDLEYSSNAQAILHHARQNADERGDVLIGTEDLLSAMFSASQETSRSRSIDRLFRRGVTRELVFGEAELSFNVQKAISAAIAEAHRLGHDRVGTEDLLWALFQKTDKNSKARHWLGSQGILNFNVAPRQSNRILIRRDESPMKLLTVGGIAGTIETLILQPLVYWKTNLQVGKSSDVKLPPIGLKTVYRGVLVNAFAVAPISAFQYAGNGILESCYQKYIGQTSSTSVLCIAGISGALSTSIVTPVEMVMISQQRFGGSISSTTRDIIRAKGIRGLFRGISTTTLRETGWTFGFLGVAPVLKTTLQEDSKFFRRNEVAASAAASVVGGQVAALLTQPLDTVKTVIQADRGITRPMQFQSSWEAATTLYRSDGIGGLWKGLTARSLRLTLAVYILGEAQQLISTQFDKVGFV